VNFLVTSSMIPMPSTPCGHLQLVFAQLAFSQRWWVLVCKFLQLVLVIYFT